MRITFSKKRKRQLLGLSIALSIGLVGSLISFFQFFNTFDQRTDDLLYKGGTSSRLVESMQKIAIVGIDDESLREYGRISTWPRTAHAKLINTLKQGGARVIAFDILFSESSVEDTSLADAIKNAGNVILPVINTNEPLSSGQEDTLSSVAIFEENAIAIGHGNMAPDEDGVIRSIPLFWDGKVSNPSLSLVTAAKYLRRSSVFDSMPTVNELNFAGRDIPLENWQMLINYSKGISSNSFNIVSYLDVINNNFPADFFKDKIVLVGVTALGFGDTYWTPLGLPSSGVEIHAQAMNTILSGHFIKPVSKTVSILLIMVLSLIVGLAVLTFRVLWSTHINLFISIAYCLLAFYLFDHGILLDIFFPIVTIFAVALGVNIYNVTIARVEKHEISNTFGKFVSSPISTKIIETINEGSLKLGGEECQVTVLFADVRGFTSFCEKLEPSVVVETINRYFSIIIDCVLEHGGIINQFAGDNVMAIWNAPIKCAEHHLSAVKAAAEIQEKIDILFKISPDIPQIKFGIGVNSGNAIAGNMGSLNRLEYSVIGDTVNVASRLSSLAPGGKIWVGQETYTFVNQVYQFEPLGLLELKGKAHTVNVYQLYINPDLELPPPVKTENHIKIMA